MSRNAETGVLKLGLDHIPLVVRMSCAADVPVVIWGRPGVGKTEMITYTTAQLMMRYFPFRASNKLPSDLAGVPVPGADGKAVWLRPDLIPFQADIGDDRAVFHPDEIDRIDDVSLYHVMLEVFQERTANGKPLGRNVRIIASGNGDTDDHTHPMYDAIASRMCHIYIEAATDQSLESWSVWASKNRLNPAVRYWMETNWFKILDPKGIESKFSNIAIANPRSVANAAKLVKTFYSMPEEKREDYLQVMQAMITGCVGYGMGLSLWASAQAQRAVRIDEILSKPLKAFVPDDAISRHATVSSLIDAMAPSHAEIEEAQQQDALHDALVKSGEAKHPSHYADDLRTKARTFAAKHFPNALAYLYRFEQAELLTAFVARVARVNDAVVATPAYHDYVKDRSGKVFFDEYKKTIMDTKSKSKKRVKKAKEDSDNV